MVPKHIEMVKRILVVDDHTAVRAGIRYILQDAGVPVQVEEAATGRQALSKIRGQDWDAVILDLSLPDRNGVEVLRDIKSLDGSMPVLILSVHLAELYGTRLLRAGAAGLVDKSAPAETLVNAVLRILNGKRYIGPDLAERLAEEVAGEHEGLPHQTLSDREYEIFMLLALGKSASEIADSLYLSVKTVYTYRNRVLRKMHLESNGDLATYAFHYGLLEDRRLV
jgi:DNA-binding NarL/FixJ family response regulator